MQLKKSVVALGLAVAFAHSQGAHAAISSGFDQADAGAQPNGELMLIVYKSAGNITYTRDTGIALNDAVTPTSFATAINGLSNDATLLSTFGGSLTGLSYMLLGANYTGAAAPGLNGGGNDIFVTSANNLLPVDVASNFTTVHGNVMLFADSTNLANGSDTLAFNTNNTTVTTTSGAESFAGSALSNGTLNGNLDNLQLSATVGSPLKFFKLSQSLTTGLTSNQLLGTFTLGADGSKSFVASGPVVPLPPAVWLLGSALAGLVGVARRQQQQTA